ncbi:hypothetical protein [Dyella silvae]|uniref:hypothetical protein n=1 Tax=Dyella silvae TaxID=2994424 RepID=UPI002263AC4F|nr:hypothetical protein [Dyella silvae]
MLSDTGSARRQTRLYFLWLSLGLFAAHQLVELLIAVLRHHHALDTCYWDCKWYAGISEYGYSLNADAVKHQANWAFFPLFPMLVLGAKTVTTLSVPLASVLLGKLFFILSIYAFIEFATRYAEQVPPLCAGMVAALSPYAIYGNTGYTEPLFLLLTCVFFIFLKERNYLGCGLVGAALSATRVPGILVALPYAVVVVQLFWSAPRDKQLEMVLGGLLIPLGLALFMLHLYQVTGDALAFVHVQKAWGRPPMGNPLSVMAEGFQRGNIHLIWALMSLTAVLIALYLMFTGYLTLGVFSLFCTLIPLATGLQSMPRYIWWQAPILLVLARVVSRRPLAYALMPIFLMGLAYMYMAWMAVKAWVV